MAKKPTPREALQKAVDICGNQGELARRIGGKVKQQHVSYWLENGLPPHQAIPVERAVAGQVTRYDLRPDIYPQEAVA